MGLIGRGMHVFVSVYFWIEWRGDYVVDEITNRNRKK